MTVIPERDVRIRFSMYVVAGAALLLAAAWVLFAGRQDLAGLAVTALVLLVPVAVELSSAVVVFYLCLRDERRPAPPALPATMVTPALAETLLAYPVIVHSSADVVALLSSLRDTRQTAGNGFAMHLALVDFADSETPDRDNDDNLRTAIEEGVARLNREGGGPLAAVLFRHRRWNQRERRYMGWERKRGKLEELTGLIAGEPGTSFDLDCPAGRVVAARLRGIRYVLTLDVGDRLLPDSAWRLVATLAHPDNAAVVDPVTGIVVQGYGFVRPADAPAPPTTVFEWALRPFPSPDNELPLSQSLFGRDAFFGVGVIDVATYRAVLAGRIPPDRVLSHDKLEGMHGRVAAIADARVVGANVPDYLAFRQREHRWIRGDVHLLPWIGGSNRGNLRRLPAADRWQMAKDIVGHLYYVAIVALLALGWLAAPAGLVGWWTVSVLALLAHPVVLTPLIPLLAAARLYVVLRRHPGRDRRWRRRLLLIIARKSVRPAARSAAVEAVRLLVWVPLLVDRALVAVDALVRAGYRTMISRRHILSWTSSAQAGRVEPGITTRLRHLWPSCLVTLLLCAAVAAVGPARLVWAGPLLVGWLAAPGFAYWTARPLGWLSPRDRG